MNSPKLFQAQLASVELPPEKWRVVDLARAVARRGKLVIALPALFAVCAALGDFSGSKVYRASAKLLPDMQTSAFPNTERDRDIDDIVVKRSNTPVELYMSMLRSKTVADSLIEQFDLKTIYGLKSLERTRQALARNSTMTVGRDGLITIEVRDTDAHRAAGLANAYPEQLNRLVAKLALTESSYRRQFYERRLTTIKDLIAQAETNGSHPREKGETTEQRRARDASAVLRARIAAKEIELGAMQPFVTVDSTAYVQGHQDIGALRFQLARMEKSEPGRPIQRFSGNAPITANSPADDDIKYYRTLSELLTRQYQNALNEEWADSPGIRVLDPASEPIRSVNPAKRLTVLAAALLGLSLAILWVLAFDVIKVRQRLAGQE